MSYYWIHVSEGINFTAFGPFMEEEARAFRRFYADDEDEDGAYRSVDDIPQLPGIRHRDDHTEDSWLLVYGNQFELLDGWPIYRPGMDFEWPVRS